MATATIERPEAGATAVGTPRLGRPPKGVRDVIGLWVPMEQQPTYHAAAARAGLPICDYVAVALARLHGLEDPDYLKVPADFSVRSAPAGSPDWTVRRDAFGRVQLGAKVPRTHKAIYRTLAKELGLPLQGYVALVLARSHDLHDPDYIDPAVRARFQLGMLATLQLSA